MDFRDAPYTYFVLTRFIGTAEELAEWELFYDEVHFPKILTVPGVLSADRYISSRDERRWLAAYGIENIDVFTTAEYHALPGIGSWRSKVTEWKRLVVTPIDVAGFESRSDLVEGTD